MKSVFLFAVVMALTVGCTSTTYVCQSVPGKPLSTHKTEATFVGVETIKCRHMTALCPDRCEHGGTVAKFKIENYLDYQKPSQYGDPKQETFVVQLTDGQGNVPKTTSHALMQVIDSLSAGDAVTLEWTHTYVDDGAIVEPRRLVTRLSN